jgi:hypothetical protein
MSSAASPAAGGNLAAKEQSGTAHAVTAAYPTPSPQNDFEIEVSDALVIGFMKSVSSLTCAAEQFRLRFHHPN